MKKLIIGSLVIGGLFLAYKHTKKIDETKVQALKTSFLKTGETNNNWIFDKMTKDEIDLFYDFFVLKNQGQNPDSTKLKISNILLRFGIIPT